ncbi:mandelate racemase/muconate lactonizing enzyme family protein [Yinghuangia sp. YIM S10712]|uniref:mandelate racemase/muconate lactonizing enzyme family protein n=1 Tax=Yinghuangia sp. YIM S10712 TaxID=3436930 RepID=UPI003F534F2C
MKIVSVESFQRDHHLAVVRVRTDDGLEGIGQTSPYLAHLSVEMLHTVVARWFLGKDPWDLEALVDRFLRERYKLLGTVLFRALSGLESALWDLLGKATGQPVYRLLGGQVRRGIPVYGSSMSRTISPQDEADRMVRLADSHGFRCFKIRVGTPMGRDADAWPGRTEELIEKVRTALGPDIGLHADANGGYSVARAIAVGRRLEDHGFLHFEEPCPYPEIENTAQVAAALDIAVAGGEQDNSLEQFQRIITGRSVDIIQPDIGYIGGISRARKVAYMAEAAGIPCTPHCSNRSLLQIFTLHLAAAMPSISQYQEWTIEDNDWARDLYGPVPEVVDGHVELTEEPGWGVQVSDGFLSDARRRVTE